MANQYKNKIVYGGNTLIDLTGDNVTAADVAQGKLFHLPSGAPAVGTASGGGGVDLPVFTVEYDSNYNIVSAACCLVYYLLGHVETYECAAHLS